MKFSEQSTILKTFSIFAKIGEMEKFETIEKEIKYKERLVFSTMQAIMGKGWQQPIDWDKITPEEKVKRLDKAIKAASCLE